MANNKKEKIKLINIKKIRFSPEIEVELPKKADGDKLIERNSMIKGWTIDSDGSLDNGMEIRPKDDNKLYFNREFYTQLKEVLALIQVHKGKVKKTCGLHIHYDVSNFMDSQVLGIITEWIHKQRYICKRFHIDKERLEMYCQLLPKEGLKKITVKDIHRFRTTESSWDSDYYEYFKEKYYSLNITHLSKGDYGTLEFRIFEATLKPKKIKECIKFCLDFIKDSLERE